MCMCVCNVYVTGCVCVCGCAWLCVWLCARACVCNCVCGCAWLCSRGCQLPAMPLPTSPPAPHAGHILQHFLAFLTLFAACHPAGIQHTLSYVPLLHSFTVCTLPPPWSLLSHESHTHISSPHSCFPQPVILFGSITTSHQN